MTRSSREFLSAAAALDAAAPRSHGTPADDQPAPATEASGVDRGHVWDALGMVIDPEIGLDIVTLGLVYSLEIIGSAVKVTFTLTTPGCPMEEAITGGIVSAVSAVESVEQVLPDLVWDPRWHPGMIQEGAL